MIYDNILQTIGDTPLVKINKINPNSQSNIYAKIEGTNPSGSIKDRIALKMIEQAEAEGVLDKTKTIIEPTSGNTGIGIAMIGAVKGYNVEIVMSSAVSIERRKLIEGFGGKVILTDADKGTDGAIEKTKEIVKDNPSKYFFPDQFSNKYNKLAHYKTTGEEIWKQTNGKVDFFVSALGTSGTMMGIAKVLKEYNPRVQIVSAHPVKGHYIQGIKNMEEAIVPALYKPEIIDITIMVDTENALITARKIMRKEGIPVGMSSGAAMYAAIEIAKSHNNVNIVVIMPDRVDKYLSTSLFE